MKTKLKIRQLHLESGRQIVWQVSSQSTVVGLRHEVVWVYTESCTVLRAVMTDFFLTVDIGRSLQITVFGMYQGASTVMRKTLDWKRSRICV
jgi:hypothetical protein